MKFLKFSEFLKENISGFTPMASWGLSALDGVGSDRGGSNIAFDPELSNNPWDRHNNDLRYSISRGSAILSDIFRVSGIKNDPEFNLDSRISEIRIIDIWENNMLNICIQLGFLIDEMPYSMTINNYNTNKPNIKSNVLSLPELRNKNIYHKFKGMLLALLREWFIPEIGYRYKTIREIEVITVEGNLFTIPIGSETEISLIDGNNINIIYQANEYRIKKREYYYFRWWFEPMEKKFFYL